MLNKSKMVGSLAGLGFFLALTPNITLAEAVRPWRCSIAQGTRTKMDMSASAEKQTSQFQKIEQPIGLKLAVALCGLGLIGAELWWFMFSRANSQHLKPSSSDQVSKTKSQKASIKQDIQEKDDNE